MRLLALLVLALTVLGAAPAEARKKKAPPKKDLLDVVVLPFGALSGSKATEAKDALELELELVDNTRVAAADLVLGDIEEAGAKAFQPATLAKIMKKRSVEVLVGTPPTVGRGRSKPLVVAWANDGKPRAFREIAAGASPDQIAATSLSMLKPALAKWSSLSPQKLPVAGAAADDDDDDNDNADDVVADETPPAKKPKKPARDPVEDDTARTTRSIDDEDAPPKKKPQRERSRVDDAEDAAPRQRRAALDDNDVSGLEGERRSLLEVADEADGRSSIVKESHAIALSGTFDGATWFYGFEGNDGVQPDPVQAPFYPGGSMRFDLWPTENLGIDASGSLSAVQFSIRSRADLLITPNKFVSWHTNAGVAVKGRYLFHLADEGVLRTVGVAGRVGYRYWGATVEQQVVSGTTENLTVVPGFQFHGLSVGPEIYIPLFLPDRRFEIDLKIDVLPLTFYSEQPDNPGGSSLAFGYNAELLMRFDLFGGFFFEAGGKSTGATINFEDEGDRITVDGANQRLTLKGGRSLNVSGGFSVGVGFMY